MLACILALILAAGIAVWLYINSLNKAMDLGDQKDGVVAALTDTPAAAGEPFYVLLMGSDTRNLETDMSDVSNEGSRSDVLTLMRVNVYDGSVSLLSIPRDTPVDDGKGGYMKINETYDRGGAGDTIDTVEHFTNLPISHFVQINDVGLETLVDRVGGVTVDVPVEMNGRTLTGEKVHLDPGTQHLNGAQAMAFARNRFAYESEGDKHRQEAARQVIQGIINQIRSAPPLEIPGIISAAVECVGTDLSLGDILDIVRKIGLNFSMTQGTGPSDGDFDPYYNDTWFCYLNPDGWARVLEVYRTGGDPGTVSYEGDPKVFPGAPNDTTEHSEAAEAPVEEAPVEEYVEYVEEYVEPVYE